MQKRYLSEQENESPELLVPETQTKGGHVKAVREENEGERMGTRHGKFQDNIPNQSLETRTFK